LRWCYHTPAGARFRPQDLVQATSVPPLEHIYGIVSKKPPAQRQLASIVHHEDWLACVLANQAADFAATADHTATRRLREVTRLLDVAQPYAGGFLSQLPASPTARHKSTLWVWAMQRRFGLWVSAAVPTFELMASLGDTSYDHLLAIP
jgi:hypothetical protein